MGFKLSWPKTKLQNVGAGDPTSTILIDGVPVEGVEEFIYLGSKQILMATADQTDVLRRIGFACSVMNSLQCMELQFSQYQHQSIPVPSTDKVCSALWYRNIHPLGRRHEYTGGFPHDASATDTEIPDVWWWANVLNAEVLQRSGLSTIGKGSISLGCACLRQIANARRKLVPN